MVFFSLMYIYIYIHTHSKRNMYQSKLSHLGRVKSPPITERLCHHFTANATKHFATLLHNYNCLSQLNITFQFPIRKKSAVKSKHPFQI